MEVVEHVADVGGYLAACTRLVKPGGLTFVATLNRTLKSLALAKIGAEYVLGWLPRGTHDWNRFLPPTELKAILEEAGLTILKTQGVSFDPLGWDWKLSSDVDVNYMIVARALTQDFHQQHPGVDHPADKRHHNARHQPVKPAARLQDQRARPPGRRERTRHG